MNNTVHKSLAVCAHVRNKIATWTSTLFRGARGKRREKEGEGERGREKRRDSISFLILRNG